MPSHSRKKCPFSNERRIVGRFAVVGRRDEGVVLEEESPARVEEVERKSSDDDDSGPEGESIAPVYVESTRKRTLHKVRLRRHYP